jgi:hypothetical protein
MYLSFEFFSILNKVERLLTPRDGGGVRHQFCGKLGHSHITRPGPKIPGAEKQVNQSPVCASVGHAALSLGLGGS